PSSARIIAADFGFLTLDPILRRTGLVSAARCFDTAPSRPISKLDEIGAARSRLVVIDTDDAIGGALPEEIAMSVALVQTHRAFAYNNGWANHRHAETSRCDCGALGPGPEGQLA